ncbi:CBU_0592 family membrane protein [Pedobacter sp.]|uniref:CBU_0592 family membrane protein n=1 Tax=Pedobacter sp. TaxID=1411316 RepID=UPI003D7F5EE0
MKSSDIIATVGVGLLLIAFFLQTLKVIKFDSKTYILLNLFGAAIAGYSSWMINFIPFVILEAVWVVVAILSLLRNVKSKRST